MDESTCFGITEHARGLEDIRFPWTKNHQVTTVVGSKGGDTYEDHVDISKEYSECVTKQEFAEKYPKMGTVVFLGDQMQEHEGDTTECSIIMDAIRDLEESGKAVYPSSKCIMWLQNKRVYMEELTKALGNIFLPYVIIEKQGFNVENIKKKYHELKNILLDNNKRKVIMKGSPGYGGDRVRDLAYGSVLGTLDDGIQTYLDDNGQYLDHIILQEYSGSFQDDTKGEYHLYYLLCKDPDGKYRMKLQHVYIHYALFRLGELKGTLKVIKGEIEQVPKEMNELATKIVTYFVNKWGYVPWIRLDCFEHFSNQNESTHYLLNELTRINPVFYDTLIEKENPEKTEMLEDLKTAFVNFLDYIKFNSEETEIPEKKWRLLGGSRTKASLFYW